MGKRWPLSITLNIIFASIFSENIRQNNDIKDILVGKKDLKTSTFAYNIHSKQKLTNTSRNPVNHFEKATGTNYDKTKCLGIWLVSTKDDPRIPLAFKSNSNAIKILGYTYKLERISERIYGSWDIYNYDSEKKKHGLVKPGHAL